VKDTEEYESHTLAQDPETGTKLVAVERRNGEGERGFMLTFVPPTLIADELVMWIPREDFMHAGAAMVMLHNATARVPPPPEDEATAPS
jgi:hypothetical protein